MLPETSPAPRGTRRAPLVSAAAVSILAVLILANCTSEPSDPADSTAIPDSYARYVGLPSSGFAASLGARSAHDRILELYAQEESRENVIEFFSNLTGSRGIAVAILEESAHYAVSPALAFSVAWEESRFNPKALNRNADSIDRGLFQLNSKSFPKLGTADFYDVATNVKHGVAHLRFTLDQGGNEIAALAMYNAGLTRVSSGGTPRRTLDYVARIERWRADLERLFELRVAARFGSMAALAAAPTANPSRHD